jgi:[acyl-carrier-protein] S-malonyltransferase
VVALLFPGQGSQFVGMGRDLAASSTVARETFREADDILGFPLSRLCFDGPESELTQTGNAQPAILTHSVAVWRALADRLDGGILFAAGHSLGEFSAYVAAGGISFADAVRTVRRRGELMETSGRDRPGTMAALLGLDDAAVEKVCREAAARGGDCVAANYNSPGQIVISGDVAAVERAVELARAAGARRAVRLNVSGAFHSPLMRVAEAGLAEQLERAAISRPGFPVVSNVTAQPVTEPAEVRRLLILQLTSPVRWTGCMQTMLAAGATRFVELGPGSVLTGLLRRIDRAAAATAIGTAAEVDAFVGVGERSAYE